MENCVIRYATREELERVNELRAEVNRIHVIGRPDIFRPGFCEELREHIYQKFDAEDSDVIVAVVGGRVCGFATAEYIYRKMSPYNLARCYYHIEEIGVDPAYRRMGVAKAIMEFCRQEASNKGFEKIELDVWEFNESAIEFYEAIGFQTFRRIMELEVSVSPDREDRHS